MNIEYEKGNHVGLALAYKKFEISLADSIKKNIVFLCFIFFSFVFIFWSVNNPLLRVSQCM